MIRRVAIPASSCGAVRAEDNVIFSYFGTVGWELTGGRTTVLLDPTLKTNTPNDTDSRNAPRQ